MDGSRNSNLRLFPAAFSAIFCKVSSGAEDASFSTLKQSRPNELFFKALGQFDIVAISEKEGWGPSFSVANPPEISSCRSLSAFSFQCGGYVSPPILEWLSEVLIAGITFLEIDKSIFSLATPPKIIKRIIDRFSAANRINKDHIAYFYGVGQSELVVLIKGDSFTDVFNLLKYARGMKYRDVLDLDGSSGLRLLPLFSSTYTIPIISYENVINPGKFNLIKGRVDVDIILQCAPGLEQPVLDEKFISKGKTKSTLGAKDIRVDYRSKRKTSDFIKGLLEFRKAWTGLGSDLIETNTTINFPIGSQDQEPIESWVIEVESIPNYSKFDEKEIVLRKQRPDFPLRIRELTNSLESNLHIRKSLPTLWCMRYAPHLIFGEIEEYHKFQLAGWDGTYPYLGSISRLLDNSEKSFAQRTETSMQNSAKNISLPANFGDGVLSPLLALEYYIGFIYRCIAETIDPEVIEWEGFVFFDDRSGFQFYEGDVFSLPYQALQCVIGDKINWLTLTHEISHAIFTILDLDADYEDLFNVTCNNIEGKKHNDNKLLLDQVKDEYYELFANWFDYTHFYNSDHDLYQRTIWKSWDAIPFVHKEKKEYIFRSFTIFALQDIDEYKISVCKGLDIKFITGKWDNYVYYLKNNLDFVYAKYDPEAVAETIKSSALKFFLPLSFILEENYYEDFKNKINQTYAKLPDHLDKLYTGYVLDEKIDNPFLLLKKAMVEREEYSGKDIDLAGFSIMLSLRNNYREFEFKEKK